MGNSMKIIRRLPDAPAPTKAAYKKPVLYNNSKHMRVVELPCAYNPRPAPLPKPMPKTKAKAKPKQRKDKTANVYKRQKWTEEKIQKVIDLYKSGMPYAEIGEKIHCSTHAAYMVIYKARSDGKIKGYRSRVDWTDEQEQEMIRLYKAGKSFKAIAKAIGRSTSNTHTKIQRLIDSGELEDRKYRRDT